MTRERYAVSEFSVFNASDDIPPEIERQIRALVASEWPDVVTAPAWRRSGNVGRIVEAATAYIRSDSEADLAVLLTEPALESWYGRRGWAEAPGLRVRTGEYEDARSAGVLPMFLVLSTALGASPGDLPELTRIVPGDEW